MAAADVPGATKGLLLIFTLFTLVHVTHSLESKQNLEILTKYYQGGLNEAAKKKAQLDNGLTRFIEDFQEDVDEIFLVVKRLKVIAEKNLYLSELPTVVDNFLNERIQQANNDIKAYEKEMQDIWDFVNHEESNLGKLNQSLF